MGIFARSSNCFKTELLSNPMSGATDRVFDGHDGFVVTQLVMSIDYFKAFAKLKGAGILSRTGEITDAE